jgi:hypothetical protein
MIGTIISAAQDQLVTSQEKRSTAEQNRLQIREKFRLETSRLSRQPFGCFKSTTDWSDNKIPFGSVIIAGLRIRRNESRKAGVSGGLRIIRSECIQSLLPVVAAARIEN